VKFVYVVFTISQVVSPLLPVMGLCDVNIQ
jgi:hypothetical protein